VTPARWLAAGAVLLAAVLLQTALLARLPLPGRPPDLVLLVVLAVALAFGANTGAIAGFAAGLLVALAPPSLAPVGAEAIAYAVVGFVVGSRAGGERLSRSEAAALGAVAGTAVAATLMLMEAFWGQGWPGLLPWVFTAVLQGACCALLATAVAPAVSSLMLAVPGRAG
jgi:rod shape-determining protein MreD